MEGSAHGDAESHRKNFAEFLQDERFDYEERLRDLAAAQGRHLMVNLNDLREMDHLLTQRLMRRPLEYLYPLMQAASQLANQLDPAFGKLQAGRLVQVGFEGAFGEHHVSPRGLVSRFLSALVCVDGIVTKVSVVRPKVVRSVHYCPETQKHLTRDYRDPTALDIGLEANGRVLLPTGSAYPQRDAEGHALQTEYGLCDFKDHQVVTIQEMPERAPHGQLPRSVDVYLDHSLVNLVKPGDRVGVSGIYRALTSSSHGHTAGIFRTVVVANAVRQLNRDEAQLKLRPEDIAAVRELPQTCAERGDSVLDVLGRSLCPSIYGHDFIKKALVLQLLGGEEVNLANGTHLRGDINMMIVGDPSTAKSQLLRAVMKHAPLAVSTTGRGSSGVGLTAAVTSDPETGERRLEAGAMVLADRGAVCIDEFDKMSEADRVAIHEVMEQQTVTIAKAGIHATLNARCSVTAAANPIYGQYDRNRRPQENIGLPDSLLSRFDLLFVVLDMLDADQDRRISEHVLRGHCFRRTTDMAPEPLVTGPVLDLGDEEEAHRDAGKSEVWVRDWHSRGAGASKDASQQMLSGLFLRKYVRYAKSRVHPTLTEEATEEIANCYADLRAKQDIKTLPVTARTLETLIRLSTGHAKARLANKVEAVDVEATMELMNFALYHERGALDEAQGAEDGQRAPSDAADSGRRKRGRSQGVLEEDAAATDAEAPPSSPEASPGDRPKRPRASLGGPPKERLQAALNEVMRSTGEERFSVDLVLDVVNENSRDPMSRAAADAILEELEEENLIMYQDGEIHTI